LDIINEIINSKEPHQLLIAAAGSGKTRTLVNLLAAKIKKGLINPEESNIVVFTFTNNAAEELLVRLSKILENENQILNKIFIGTIHGWCNQFLQNEGMLANTKIIDELEQAQLILRIYPLIKINEVYQEGNKYAKIKKFLKDLELFYNENLEINNKIIPEKIRLLLVNYIDFIKSQRLLDFGSLMRETILLLKQKESGLLFHIFVDEYQDVNPAQVKLIQFLLNLNTKSTLFAVGDPRQAIYQWRGSDIHRILEFKNDFKDVQIFSLRTNHRSRTGIVNFANIIANNMNFESEIEIEDMLTSKKREDNKISVIHETNPFKHEEHTVKIIKKLLDSGIEPAEIAILMRSVVNEYGRSLFKALHDAGIHTFSPNMNLGITFIEEFMISIIELMELMDENLIPANRQEEEEIEKKVEEKLKLIKNYCGNVDINHIHISIANWRKKLMFASKKGKYKNENYNFRHQFFEFCQEVGFYINPDEIDIQEGFSAISQIMRAMEEIYRRRFHGSMSIRPAPMEVFTNNLKWHLTYQIERWTETGMEINGGNRVTISTVHAAKGLEWPVIIVPFFWKNRFPLKKSNHGTSFPDSIAERYGTTIEDEKRLWYVAVTRARDRLYFFSGSSRNREPSPFCYSHEFDTNSPLGIIKTGILSSKEDLSEIEHYSQPKYFHLGVSDFLILLECPYHFYLRRIKGINVPVGEQFGAGNILHKIIERLIKEQKITDYEKIIEEQVYLPLAEFFYQNQVKNSIKKKIQALIDSGLLGTFDYSEFPFIISLQDMIITGIIDATRNVHGAIEIIDWKSSVKNSFKDRYENQIKIYTAGLRMGGYNVLRGLIYDLNSIGTSEFELVIDISENTIENLIEKAKAALMTIKNKLGFTCPNAISCGICDVKYICPDVYC